MIKFLEMAIIKGMATVIGRMTVLGMVTILGTVTVLGMASELRVGNVLLIVRAAVHPMMIKWTLYVITDDGRRPNYRLSNEG